MKKEKKKDFHGWEFREFSGAGLSKGSSTGLKQLTGEGMTSV